MSLITNPIGVVSSLYDLYQNRENIGAAIERAGTNLGANEYNISETVAGGNTPYTGSTPQNRAETIQMSQNVNSPYPIGNATVGYTTGGSFNPGNVLGSTNTTTQQTQQTRTPSPSGVNLKDPNTRPEGEGWFWDAADGWKQSGVNQDIMAEVMNAYNAAMGVAGQAESAIRGYQPELEASIGRTAADQEALTNTSYERGGRQIAQAEGSTKERERNAISEARQILSEMGLGFGQRFGAASNMARALGEYATTKFQQTAGRAKDATQAAMAQLNEQKLSLEENFKNTMQQISTWRQNTIAEAQREFQNKLLEIGSMKLAAESEKSQQRIAELQRLQQNIDQAKFLAYQYSLRAQQDAQAKSSEIRSAWDTINARTTTGVTNVDTANAAAQASNVYNPFKFAPVSGGQAIQQAALTGNMGQFLRRPDDELYK